MERYNQEGIGPEDYNLGEGTVAWRSPSNIALVKYWGKYGDQLPRNPSISFTLDAAHTETRIRYQPAANAGHPGRTFLFEGKPQPHFEKRIFSLIDKLSGIFPFLRALDLEIHSANSFPHSSGIASSASAMSALSLCLCTIEQELSSEPGLDAQFWEKASFVARLGSGSACRSLFPELVLWGYDERFETSSDFYAVPMADTLHPSMRDMQDSILIVSKAEKAISSSDGHTLMENHRFAPTHYQHARIRLGQLSEALSKGDLETFGALTEAEALELHALMMCSNPPYMLVLPDTVAIIQELWRWRSHSKVPVYFTLDAGPNVHLLYPSAYEKAVAEWLENDVAGHYQSILHDRVGQGPQLLSEG